MASRFLQFGWKTSPTTKAAPVNNSPINATFTQRTKGRDVAIEWGKPNATRVKYAATIVATGNDGPMTLVAKEYREVTLRLPNYVCTA